MTEERQWKRPDQVETFRTSDPKEMLGKYLPKHVLKTWKEDFIDEDTHEVVTIDRNEVIVESGEIEPIPLTAEILAQNGFSKSRLMGEQRHFTYYLGPSLSMLAIYDADFSVHIGDGARYVKNVHQLQHILKVCGIEKEIKIKEQ